MSSIFSKVRTGSLYMLSRLLDGYVYTAKDDFIAGLKIRGDIFYFYINRYYPSAEEKKFLMSLDLEGQTVYDIGGWKGIFTIFFASKVGEKGRVYVFEPNPVNIKKIIGNVNVNHFSTVQIVPLGLSDKKTKIEFIYNLFSTDTGTMVDEYKSHDSLKMPGTKKIIVDIDTADNLLDSSKIPQPSFIKIDTEGAEFQILMGMAKIIKQYKPRLFIEVHGENIGHKKRNIGKILCFLEENNYKTYYIEGHKTIMSNNFDLDARQPTHIYCQ